MTKPAETIAELCAEFEAHDFEGLTAISADEMACEIYQFMEYGHPSSIIPEGTSEEILKRQHRYVSEMSKRWELAMDAEDALNN